ncbi:DUF167 family protein [Microvirga sp. 17 mud 1-3]|uniref:DUF167 family protein n=1 Tax=Microvirga sp. 17 mud 1-3 TaxID=2082949 RepID=UPI000D6B8863|nr:DUF167 family protein [Microvirga sp. 17 mud 1-3]AWM85641.1 hypothetical protein C4E04_02030 [Microvirga sp. 17 mud 1-3]
MPCRPRSGGIEIRVRATPRGGRDAVEGIEALADGSRVLKVRVRVAPEDGAANEAVRRLLAKALGVPASAVTLATGATARLKTFFIEGDAAALAARFAALTGQDS